MVTDSLPSIKGQYPFRVCAPSFIFPADYTTNAQRLADHLDEIEVLVFESHPQSLPSRQTIDELASIASDRQITYNVHLPLDLELGAESPVSQGKASDLLRAAIERVLPLDATTHTLHLNYREKDHLGETIRAWQARTIFNLRKIIDSGLVTPGKISVETLDYPPDYFGPIVKELDLAVCLDIGHLIRYGFDRETVLNTYQNRMDIIHLHGVVEGEDHHSTDNLDSEASHLMIRTLRNFTGSLSLEVFNHQRLSDSLKWLKKIIPPRKHNC
jgi:sugar phosphate isomerase/epimerase